MARYIDADALADEIVNTLKRRDYASDSHTYACFKTFIEILDDAPTTDVVEVVRCYQCIHSSPTDLNCSVMCHRNEKEPLEGEYKRPIDFCSYGERRTDDGNL